jgi:primase-polymerase (primpol)-like protein
LTDAELLARARNARNGPKFTALYDAGDCSGYPSESEADFALLVLLANWTGSDPDRMERLFNGSDFGRRDKLTDRPDYRARSITNAIERNNGNAPARRKASPPRPRKGAAEGAEANGYHGGIRPGRRRVGRPR